MNHPQKRILIFNDTLSIGGTEKLLVNLLNHLANNRCKITLLLPKESKDNVLLAEVPGEVAVRYLYSGGETSATLKKEEIGMIFRTRAFLKSKNISEEDYDEVICFKEGMYAKMFSEWKISNVLWIHNMLYVRSYELRSLKERLAVWLNKKEIAKLHESYTRYDKVVCVSEACRQSYLNVIYNGRPTKQDIRIVPNAIDKAKIKMLGSENLQTVFDDDTVNFILLTRLSPDKRIDRILAASSRLVKEGYQLTVHILGNGTNSQSIKEELEGLGLQKNIILYGEIQNPYPYVKQADWLICVSQRESFSLALLEAMILDVPVISTNCGGPANILKNGKYGLLVENSTEGVYMGMKAVLDNKNLSEKYIANLEECVRRYDFESWYKEVDGVLL